MEDENDIMVAGSVRPLVDAFRIAQVELIEWLVDEYGFDKMEAYQIVSQAGHSAHRQRRRSELHGDGEVPEEAAAAQSEIDQLSTAQHVECSMPEC